LHTQRPPKNLEGSRTPDVLRSPLAKRKKIVTDRSGFSKLKEAITAEDLDEASLEVVELEEGEGDEEDEEDDFLTRELGEEWG
jgi:RNA polymerase II subunit A-like phosphatase